MNTTEIAVITICALVGYWVVGAFFVKKAGGDELITDPQTDEVIPAIDCFLVLGLSPTASTIEIRDAYRKLISQYHPDRVSGLGQELRDLAEKKSKEIIAAYRQALSSRGEAP